MFSSTPGTSVCDRRQDGVDRDLGLRGELAVPECVEVGGTRRRESDLRRRHRGADGVEPVVAPGVAAGETGASPRPGPAAAVPERVAGRAVEVGVRFHRDVDHLRLVAGDFDLVLAGGEIQLAFLEHHRVVAANRPLVRVGGRDRPGRHRPADRFADVVDAAGVIRRECELLWRSGAALREGERGGEQNADAKRERFA